MCIHVFGRKEGNILFNDALNTFYLRLYGVIHMVKDYSDSERGNPLPPHGLPFSINSKGSFICTIPHRIPHTTVFVTLVVEHWLDREIACMYLYRKPLNFFISLPCYLSHYPICCDLPCRFLDHWCRGGGGGKGACPSLFLIGGAMVCLCPHTHTLLTPYFYFPLELYV